MLDQKAFLESYSRALVPAMLKENIQDEIKEMAALLGMLTFLLLRTVSVAQNSAKCMHKVQAVRSESSTIFQSGVLDSRILCAMICSDESAHIAGEEL